MLIPILCRCHANLLLEQEPAANLDEPTHARQQQAIFVCKVTHFPEFLLYLHHKIRNVYEDSKEL